jgi:hypothetical protein
VILADESKIGKDWGDDELDAIVADYFDMLRAELAGQPYVKAHHSAALMDRIGRTHRSVEFKHMNISAVLAELGLPTIRGYKPKENYQNAIFDAIDRYLSGHRAALAPQAALVHGVAESGALWQEAPPSPDFTGAPRPARLERLIRKFDPVERDFRNRTLGEAGEQRVFEFECQRLMSAARADLARKVRWVSKEDGDGAGYDILSFEPERGAERLIEVKTTNGGRTTPFFITCNEKSVADERPTEFRLYRVFDFAREARLFTLEPPLERALVLNVETWRAGFR